VGYEGTEASPTYSNAVAVFFTVPAEGLRLDTITVAVTPFATLPTTMAFQVAPDNGGQPSTWMLDSGVQLSGETVFTFTAPFTTPLTKGATLLAGSGWRSERRRQPFALVQQHVGVRSLRSIPGFW
jgi:hypothetical protein